MTTEMKSFECCCSTLKYWDLYTTHRRKHAGERKTSFKRKSEKKNPRRNGIIREMQSEAPHMQCWLSAVYSGGVWVGREHVTTVELL